MVGFVITKGYLATSVADLIGHAGISRRTFYELFPDREELLRTAFRACAESAIDEDSSSVERAGGPTRQLEALMRHLCRRAREHPGEIVLCAVEIAAAKSGAFELREAFMKDYAGLIQKCLGSGDEQPMPQALACTLAGAAHRALSGAIRLRRVGEMTSLGSELARWTRSYHPVPTGLDIDRDALEPWPPGRTARR
jgi:AcrR family transcriptional regulator